MGIITFLSVFIIGAVVVTILLFSTCIGISYFWYKLRGKTND